VGKYAYFSALNLYVPLKENEHFFDDGVVEDFNSYIHDLSKKYPEAKLVYPEIGLEKGMCVSIGEAIGLPHSPLRIFRKKHVHIVYKSDNLWTRGHEEAHALKKLGKLKYLFSKIGKRYGKVEMISVMLEWLFNKLMRNEEYIGYVGTALALHQRGRVKSVSGTSPPFSETVNLIKFLYKSSGPRKLFSKNSFVIRIKRSN
jgi:hypothetical protein